MGRGPSSSRPVLDLFVEQWPMLMFVPAILILIAVLAGVTSGTGRTRSGRPKQPHDEPTPPGATRSPHAPPHRWRPEPPPVVTANALQLFLVGGPARSENLGERPRTVNATSWHSRVRGEAVLDEQVAWPMAHGCAW